MSRMVSDAITEDNWRLRRATLDDINGICALGSKPLVYRYLFDGAAPSRELIAGRVEQSIAEPAAAGLGMWLLEDALMPYAGCVELRSYPAPRSAELTYLLDPGVWGRGLAVRMAWTVISHAFRSSHIDAVIAGADLPNSASLVVMQRLGMEFHKEVAYPLGGGVEYVLRRGDAGPTRRPALIPMSGLRTTAR